MNAKHFAKFARVKRALDAVEKAHPNCAATKVLHECMWDVARENSQLFTDEQLVALSGGTKED